MPGDYPRHQIRLMHAQKHQLTMCKVALSSSRGALALIDDLEFRLAAAKRAAQALIAAGPLLFPSRHQTRPQVVRIHRHERGRSTVHPMISNSYRVATRGMERGRCRPAQHATLLFQPCGPPGHPFIAPATSPRSRRFFSNTNMRMTGSTAKTMNAVNRPHSMPRSLR